MKLAKLLFLSLFVSSCVGVKYLQEGEYILYSQKIKAEGSMKEDPLYQQLASIPNSRIPFLPISPPIYTYQLGLHFYDTAKIQKKRDKITTKYQSRILNARSEKKKSKLISKKSQKEDKKNKAIQKGNQLMRWGEQVVVLDSTKINNSIKNLNQYLFSKGYFNNQVNYSVETDDRIAFVKYQVSQGHSYIIDSIIYQIQDPKLEEILQTNINPSNIINKRYDESLLASERDRIYTVLSNNGYFNFKRQYIFFEVDTVMLSHQRIVIRETITNPPHKNQHIKHKLDSVIFANEAAKAKSRITKQYRDVTYLINDNKYSEKLLGHRIFLHKDSLYSKIQTLETQKQLSYMDIFKFVNINYDTTGGRFIANIFTSPLQKYQTSSEVGFSTLGQAQSLPGPFFNFNAKSRNIFGGLEIVQLVASASLQGVKSFSQQVNNYSRIQYGSQLSVTFPQFLFPLSEERKVNIGKFNPRTKIATGLNFEDRVDEYKRTTLNASWSYIWQLHNNSLFTVKPFDLSYISSVNRGIFKERLLELEDAGYKSLVSAFRSSFVSSSSLQFSYNNNNYGLTNNNSSLTQGYIETGGHIRGITNRQENLLILRSDTLETYQYFKLNLDYRKSNKISSKAQITYRLNTGAVYAFNRTLPYEKYFFAGGSNSIRAWQPRRLGPGAFAPYYHQSTNENIQIDNEREQQGDIIIESSIEFRHDLFGFVDYALFVDAGNIWLWRSQTIEKSKDEFEQGTTDDGIFRFATFPREIALGAGLGLRFDFSFLVMRIDMAYKVIDPAYPLGKRFILPDYKINDLWNLKYKGVLNIGIGYPF